MIFSADEFFEMLGVALSKANRNTLNFEQDNSEYINKVNELKRQIEKAIDHGNKELFMNLTKRYNMMVLEL